MAAGMIRPILRVLPMLLCLMSTALFAESDLREYRLLKSWGIQSDSDGRLRFRPGRTQKQAPLLNWQPDLSPYRTRPVVEAGESLNPVVISAKQK